MMHPGTEPHAPSFRDDAMVIPEPLRGAEPMPEYTLILEPIVLLVFVMMCFVGWTFVRELRELRDNYNEGKISEGTRNAHHITLVLIWVSLMAAFAVTAWPVIGPWIGGWLG